MKKAVKIFEQGQHSWHVLARDPDKRNDVIDTNEYVISDGDSLLLTDPGGMEIFPAVFAALSEIVDPRRLRFIFASHQDPDIISSLALWMEVNPQLKCYLSWLWSQFVTHFGGDEETFVALPDAGMDLSLGALRLQAIPAHYLHSSGNLHLYDEQAQILFSGDVGAALLPAAAGVFVQDFDAHIKHAKHFHQRWMGSQTAKLVWCERAAALKIEMLCPQHGAIYRGADVERFINWFSELPVGVLDNTL